MKVVEFKNVSKSYPDRKILDDVNLTINQGDFVHLQGSNGAGKTTLIELIAGIETPDSGEISIFGRSPQDPGSRNWMGMMLQKIRSPETLKVEEVINLFRHYHPHPFSITELLTRSDLQHKRQSSANPDELAGGEERKLHFALAIAGNPDFLILDEPTAHLAPDAIDGIFKQIREFSSQGKTILLVTHPKSDLTQFSDLVTQELHLARDEEICQFTQKQISNPSLPDGVEKEATWELSLFEQIKKTLTSLGGQTQVEFLQLFRKPLALFGMLVLYCFTAALPKGATGNLQYLTAIAGFGLLLTTIQTFGLQIATERKQGWLATLRTTSLPAWVYLASKVIVALILSGIGIGITFAIGILYLDIQQLPEQWATIAGCLLVGVIPFAMLGFAIAHLFDAEVIPIISLPIIGLALFTSNVMPLSGIPNWLRSMIPFSPFYHYAQLVMRAGHLDPSLSRSSINLDSYPFLHIEWMVWTIMIASVFAVWSYRRNRSWG